MIQTQIEHYSCFATLLHSKGNFNSLIDLPIGDCTKSTPLWKRCVPHRKYFIICTYSQDTKGKQVNTCLGIQRPYLVKVPLIRRTISSMEFSFILIFLWLHFYSISIWNYLCSFSLDITFFCFLNNFIQVLLDITFSLVFFLE